MLYNQSEMDHIKDLLKIPAPNTTGVNEVQPINEGVNKLFVIANKTRKICYFYATISSAGNISIHAMSPFSFVDDSQRELQYRKKTCYVSVNIDGQQNPNNPTQYYNNNYGNLRLLLKPNIEMNGRLIPNHYNTIELHDSRIKEAIIPADIDFAENNIQMLNAPAFKLKQNLDHINSQDIPKEDKIQANLLSYQEYTQDVLKLIEAGYLTHAFVLINPTSNSVSISSTLEENMDSKSNPFMSWKTVSQQGLPLSKLPVVNKYNCVVQIIETPDLSVMFSDNDAMLGERVVYKDEEAGTQRESMSVVAFIKDYNNNTPLLVSLLDAPNINNANTRGRVESFKALLDKGITTFEVKGSLSPIVRLKDSNSARNGNIIFGLNIISYKPYQAANLRSSMEADSFAVMDFETIEGAEELVQSFIAEKQIENDINTMSSNTMSSNKEVNSSVDEEPPMI